MIIFFTNTYPFGSGEEFIENEIEYLAAKDSDVAILALSAPEGLPQTRSVPENVKAYRCGFEVDKYDPLKNFSAALFGFKPILFKEIVKHRSLKKAAIILNYYGRYARHLKKCIDTIGKIPATHHKNSIYSYWFTDAVMIGIYLKKHFDAFSDAKIITRAHGFDLYRERNKLSFIPFREYCLNEINNVFCCSQDGSDYMKRDFPSYADKISCSYLGTKDIGINIDNDKSVFTVASCSALIPLKRVHILAECVRMMLDRQLPVKWYCIGDGDEADKLKALFTEEEKRNNVFFMGHMSNSQVLELYKSNPISAFVNTSSTEGLPVSIMEALSFGIPAFATNVGGVNEIVKDGISGALMPADLTPTILMELLVSYMDKSNEDKKQLRNSAREYWNSSFNAENNYCTLFNNINN